LPDFTTANSQSRVSVTCENGQNRTNLALQKGLFFIVMIWASRTNHFG
jgi:hypothetical protein